MPNTTAIDVNKFDPFGKPFRDDPIAHYGPLVQASPGFCEMEGVPSAWVASYADVTAVLRDPVKFSSVKPKNLPGMEKVDFFNGLPVMNYSDDPMHARLRRIVAPAFSPKRAKDVTDGVRTVLDGLLEKLDKMDRFDVMGDLTKVLSMEMLLGRFMGVPREKWAVFLEFLGTIPLLEHVKPGGPKPQPYLEAWARGVEYCRASAERAAREKTDDLVGVLVNARDEGGTLSDDEMMAMLVVLFIGGITTVASTVASSVVNLAAHPEVAERIRQNPALAGKLYEESLRLSPPVMLVMRFATADVELSGRVIRAGTPVYTLISAACNDPAAFPDPQKLNIDRPNLIEHLGFGRGIHACIGNAISRATAPMVINAMAQRFPQLKMAPGATVQYDSLPRSRHISTAELLTR